MSQTLIRALMAVAAAAALSSCMGDTEVDIKDAPPPVVAPTEEQPTPENPGQGRSESATLLIDVTTPEIVSVGQIFDVTIRITNSGLATARSVAPQTPVQAGLGNAVIRAAPNPGVVTLEGGQSHEFVYTYEAIDPGAIALTTVAEGFDTVHEYVVNTPDSLRTILVQSPPLLTAHELIAPGQVLVGDDVLVTMTVSNGGQATAMGVTPDALAAIGSGAMEVVSGPTPASADIAGGATATFEWVLRPTQPGSFSLASKVAGADMYSGAMIQSPEVASRATDVETPANLDLQFQIPNMLSTGQKFTGTLVVRNTGTSPARFVVPDPFMPQVTTENGSASATPTGSHQAMDVPGGGTVTFSWDFVANGTGILSLVAGARGEEGISKAMLLPPAAASGPSTIVAPAALLISEFVAPQIVNRGQTFQVSMKVQNNGGVTVNNVVPTPNPFTVTKTGGANLAVLSQPSPQSIAAGATATFVWTLAENGTSPGSLVIGSAASGASSNTGGLINANATQSNLVTVVNPPELQVETVISPARVSRGQTYDVEVVVRNVGGSTAGMVLPTLTVDKTGSASATVVAPASASISPGTKKGFIFKVTENGTATGTLTARASASGIDPATGQVISAAEKAGAATTVQTPAALTVSNFVLPAKLNRGQSFALSMTVTNSGQASALAVLPNPAPPTATITGGVVVANANNVTAVTIPGGQSQTFTWFYTESGGSQGTLKFTATARGTDANSTLPINVVASDTNVASVEVLLGCNGSQLYFGIGGRSLDSDRPDALVGTNRMRVKPYSMLVAEYQRALGTTPSRIQNQAATFNAPAARWSLEPELSGVSLYTAFDAAFEGCLSFTSSATQFSANPTTTTATTQCTNFARRFWGRTPTSAELTPCVNFAVSSANNDTNPRRRWAYVCAATLSSIGFLAH